MLSLTLGVLKCSIVFVTAAEAFFASYQESVQTKIENNRKNDVCFHNKKRFEKLCFELKIYN